MQSFDSNYSVPPFPAFPSVTRYVPVGSVRDAFERVKRSIDAREGITLVLGPPGTGKTLICGLIEQQYRDAYQVVRLGEGSISDANDLRRQLLSKLAVKVAGLEATDLQMMLAERICETQTKARGLLILIDEAQSLSIETLESIRLVTNIMLDGQPRVGIVLCGNMGLEETLVSSKLEAFNQRVATRCYLHPMNAAETRQYIHETIRNCDADPEQTITAEAVAAVHHACAGIPRLINQIMTEAVDCAAEAEQTLIDEQIIDQAWARLQQLPSPMIDEPKLATQSAPIEFGELSGEAAAGDTGSDLRTHHGASSDESTVTNDLEIVRAAERDSCQIEPDLSVDAEDVIVIEDRSLEIARETSPTISPTSLFGEFEVEEEIPIGNHPPAPVSAVSAVAADNDIESVLHQEVIGISSLATGGLRSYQSPIEELVWDDEVAWETEPREPENTRGTGSQNYAADSQPTATEAIDSPQSKANVSSSNDADKTGDSEGSEPAPRILSAIDHGRNVFRSESEIDERDLSLVKDDSDLLVIEDEIELTRVDNIKRVDAREQTISVDFQAMLSRMRSKV